MSNALRPVAPMSLDEARRMISDPEFALQFCKNTRMAAFQMLNAHRRGDRVVVVVFRSSARPTTPGDAA
jgi:hypothetical protein